MNKEEMEKLVRDNLIKLNNKDLEDQVVRDVMEKFDPQMENDWEQLRGIKRRVDQIWVVIKRCSENAIVSKRVERLMDAFPRPGKKKT